MQVDSNVVIEELRRQLESTNYNLILANAMVEQQEKELKELKEKLEIENENGDI